MVGFFKRQWIAILALVLAAGALLLAVAPPSVERSIEVYREVCVDGAPGEQGETGEQGEQGLTGEQGLQGETGPPGICGPEGASGASGPEGPPGPAGDVGPAGPEGPQGERGLRGLTGDTGPIGLTGPAGPEGPAAPETSYTVGGGTISGTQPTFTGDPRFYGSYVRNGNLVYVRINVDFDNITNFGTGQYYVTVPFAAKYDTTLRAGYVVDDSRSNYWLLAGRLTAGSTQMTLWRLSSNKDEEFEHNSPVVLTTTDSFHISGEYLAQ
ncbi:MAG: hypothetical protein RL247_609 [Actinomycetota bacterium]